MKIKHKAEYKPKLTLCPYCNTEVLSPRKHYLQHHRNETLSCIKCDGKFRDPRQLERHRKNNFCPAIKDLTGNCGICDNKYFTQLKRHQEEWHRVRERYQCDHCDKLFTQKFKLNRHKRDIEERNVKKQCPECNNFYTFLDQHIRRFHRGMQHKYTYEMRKHPTPEEFKCGLCDNIFKRDAGQKESDRFSLHLNAHFPALFEKYGITLNMKTEDGLEREELAEWLVKDMSTRVAVKPEKLQCLLCSKQCETKQDQASAKSKMLFHMKHHLGFSHKKKVSRDSICPDCGALGRSHSSDCSQQSKTRDDNLKGLKSDPNKTRVKCHNCSKILLSSQKAIHAKDCVKPFQGVIGQIPVVPCHQCGKVMPANSLAEHPCGQHDRAAGAGAAEAVAGTAGAASGAGGAAKAAVAAGARNCGGSIRVRCPQCGLVILQEDKYSHARECPGNGQSKLQA